MRSHPDSRPGPVINKIIAAAELLCDFVAVRNINDDGASALVGIARGIDAKACFFSYSLGLFRS